MIRPFRRPGKDFQLGHGKGPLADRSAHAIAARVAAANHHHVLALGIHGNVAAGDGRIAGQAAILLHEEIHRKVDTL